MVTEVQPGSKVKAGSGWLGAAFLLAAFNLRPAIAAVSPVLPMIRESDRLSPAAAGLLTSMPLVCFGAMALLAPRLVHRRGASGVMLLCLVGLICGIAIRSLPMVWTLFVGTFAIGASVGVCNVLMPGVVKKDFPRHVALLTGLYTTMLSIGPSAGAGLTAPLAHAFGGSWRLALAFWSLPVVLAVAGWLPFRGRDVPLGTVARRASVLPRGLWRNSTAWSISLYMGLQALNFFTVLTWLPTILQDHGLSAIGAGTLLAILNIVAVVASLLAPHLSERVGGQWTVAIAAAAVNAVGMAGLLLDGSHLQLLWAVLIGLGQGAAISMALMMMVVRAADSRYATSLSGMAQGVGYLFAAGGPVVAGALFDLSSSWSLPLLVLIGLLAVQATMAWRAGRRPGVIGETDTGPLEVER